MESEQALDECGCAPSARERRLLWPVSRRGCSGLRDPRPRHDRRTRRAPHLSGLRRGLSLVGRRGGAPRRTRPPRRPRSPRSRRSSRRSPMRSLPSASSRNRQPMSSMSRSRRTSMPPTARTSCSCRRTSRPRRPGCREQGRPRRRPALPQRRRRHIARTVLLWVGRVSRRPARAPRHDGQAHGAQPRRLRRGHHRARRRAEPQRPGGRGPQRARPAEAGSRSQDDRGAGRGGCRAGRTR